MITDWTLRKTIAYMIYFIMGTARNQGIESVSYGEKIVKCFRDISQLR